jgi:hypothetical protein
MNPSTPPVSSPLPSAPTALLRRLEWQARHAVNTSVSGDYRSAFRGRGMEFDQVVKYQWGDDPRDIDWNVTARLGEPYRKRFVEERDLSVIFVFEDSPALQFGSEGRTRRETLLETAALLMLISSINKDRVGLLYSSPDKSRMPCALPHSCSARSRRHSTVLLSARCSGDSCERLRRGAACCSGWGPLRQPACRRPGESCSSVIRRSAFVRTIRGIPSCLKTHSLRLTTRWPAG